jgi:hypothetical protein
MRERLIRAWNFVVSTQFLSIVQTVGIIGAFVIATLALRADARKNSAVLMLEFDKMLSEKRRVDLINSIEKGDCVLKDGGQFSGDDVDDLLGVYDLLNVAYRNKLINYEMVEEAFSWDFERVYHDGEVQDTLRNERAQEGEPDLFEAVDQLASSFGITVDPVFRSCKPVPALSPASVGKPGQIKSSARSNHLRG